MDAVSVTINLVLLIFEGREFMRAPRSHYAMFRFCYVAIFGFGLIFVVVMDHLVGYKFPLTDLNIIELYFLSGYGLIVLGAALATLLYSAFTSKQRRTPQPIVGIATLETKTKLITLCLLSVSCLTVYIGMTGFSFGQSSYEERYEELAGLGILFVFMPAFLPYAAYRLSIAENRSRFVVVGALTIAYSGLIFVALNGYRQILIGAFLLVFCIGLSKRHFGGFWFFLSVFAILPSAALGLSFIRYIGEIDSPFVNAFEAGLYYLQGDIFPVDAPLKTYWYCSYYECLGPEAILNHFAKLVPRFLWPDKPPIVLDSAGYYTQVIVGYGRFVTLSATILGEALIGGGWIVFTAIMAVSGFLTQILTLFTSYGRSMFVRFVLLSNLNIGFFWVREGLEEGINRIIVMTIYMIVGSVAGTVLAIVVRGDRNPQRQQRVSVRP